MGLQLNPVSVAATPPEDQSWLGSADGTQYIESITLDVSKFPTSPFTGLLVKSGCVLAKLANGKYCPCDSDGASPETDPVGVLFTTIDLTNGGLIAAGTDSGAAMLTRGKIVVSKAPYGTTAGALGAFDATVTGLPAAYANTATFRAISSFVARFRFI